MESQVIANILYIFGNIFRIYLIYQLLKVFFTVEGTRRMIMVRYVLYVLFFAVNSISFLYWHWDATVTLLSNIVGVFIITLSYSGKWKYRIIAAPLIVGLNLICEDLVYKLMIQLGIGHIVVITIAISDLLLLAIVVILQKLVDFKHGEEILFLEWAGIILISGISIVLSAVSLDKCEGELAIVIGGIGLLILNVVVFYLFDHLARLYRNHSQMIALEVQNHAYEKQLNILLQSEENISALRHDMKNHIIALQQFAKRGNEVELQKYLDGMQTFLKPEDVFSRTGELLVDGLVNLKLSEASKRLSSEVKCEVQVQQNNLIDKVDLSILLGNLLDNALQALERCDIVRRIEFVMEEKNGLLFIQIRNNYNGQICKSGSNFITTKNDKVNHGIGLKNVERIIKKYKGKIDFEYDEQYFSVKVLLFID